MSTEIEMIDMYDHATNVSWIIKRHDNNISFDGYYEYNQASTSVSTGLCDRDDINLQSNDKLNTLLDSNKYIMKFSGQHGHYIIMIENKTTGSITKVECWTQYGHTGNALCEITKYNILHRRKLTNDITTLTNRISEYDNQLALVNSKLDLLVNFIDLIVEKSPENLAKIKDIITG